MSCNRQGPPGSAHRLRYYLNSRNRLWKALGKYQRILLEGTTMDNPRFTKNHFLLSSFVDNPDQHFQGYAMVGTDYISGTEGARAYEDRRGSRVGAGEDGCYVSVVRSGDDFVFSVDFAGNMKLFYTWTEDHWAVSNSLTTILEHLKQNGVQLSPNFAQLKAAGYGKKASVLNQLTSHSTIANNIRLAPLGATLTVGRAGMKLQRLKEQPSVDYRSSLQNFCSLWTSRIVTLLDAGVAVSSDLTGGIDSRSVVAMLQAARENSRPDIPKVSIRSGIIRGDTSDLEIATRIASYLQFPINPAPKPSTTLLKGESSYDAWYRLSLGSYHPIYFPGADTDAMVASLGGGGGENHRPFYAAQDFDAFVSSTARQVTPSWLAAQFSSEMHNSKRQINAHQSGIDPIILHYRNFRNRFHTGLAAQFSVKFTPLGSKYLEAASNSLSKAGAFSPNINFDIIGSTTPELLDFDFDDVAKAPTEADMKALTQVELEITPGEAFVADTSTTESSHNGNSRPIELLRADFRDSLKHTSVSEFWGEQWLTKTQETLTEAVDNGRFAHATDGQPIGAVIASRIVLT